MSAHKKAGIPPRLREDLYVSAAIVTLILAVVSLIGWIATWPGWVVPRALSIIGVGSYVGIRLFLGRFDMEFNRTLGVPAHAARWAWYRSLVIVPIFGCLLAFVYPMVARALGGLVLVAALWFAVPTIARAAKHRYADS